MAESLYGGCSISLASIAFFASHISKDAQVTAIRHFPFKLLKHGTLRDLGADRQDFAVVACLLLVEHSIFAHMNGIWGAGSSCARSPNR